MKIGETNNKRERGQVLIPLALTLVALLGMAGIGVDVTRAFTIKSVLRSAVDSAVLAAAQAQSAQRESAAGNMFNANFPSGFFGSTNLVRGPVTVSNNRLSLTGTVNMPTYFMAVMGLRTLTLNATAEAQLPNTVEVLVLDEDAIDDGHTGITAFSGNPTRCGNGNKARCVNDDIANLNQRTSLFTRGLDVTLNSPILQIETGQTGDEGVFRFTRADPQVSAQNGAQFTAQQYFNGTGTAANENNLDKIRDVFPLRSVELNNTVGKTFCAIVYDSDISLDASRHEASLKGSTLGRTAFTVVSTVARSGSYLPYLRVSLIPSSQVATTCSSVQSGAGSASGSRVYLTR
jgi:hypothetical protein